MSACVCKFRGAVNMDWMVVSRIRNRSPHIEGEMEEFHLRRAVTPIFDDVAHEISGGAA